MKNHVHVLFTAIAAALTVTGNVAGCVARLVRCRSRDAAFRALMLHLSVSDGLMGVYLAIISVAHRAFGGHYLWHDITWRQSEACHLSAFLSVLSSQVSAGMVCLLVLDTVAPRCVRLARARFQPLSVHLSCVAAWLIGMVVTMVTTIDMASGKFESHEHALCTLTLVSDKPGASGVFSVHIIWAGVLHVLTAAGEIYSSCKGFFGCSVPNPVLTIGTSADETKRLVQSYIATSKVLCWFVVSLPVTAHMGGITLPEEVPVNIAVFVLPLNAALNPLLSVLAVVVTRRRQAQQARLVKILAARATAKRS